MFLQELQYFITTAEHLSFTTAASQLFITQSGLSKQISKMEQDLGTALFHRSSRSMELTKAGEEFFKLAKDFLGQCNDLRVRGVQQEDLPHGDISLGVSSHYGHYGHIYLTAFLSKLRDRVDRVDWNIETRPIHQLHEGFLNGELDAIVTTASHTFQEPDISYCVLLPRKRHVIVSKHHPLATAERICVGDLRNEPFVTIARQETPVAFDMVISLCNYFGFYPRIVRQTDNFDTLYMLVESDRGIAISCVIPDPSVCPNARAVPIDESGVPESSFAASLGNDLLLAWRDSNRNPMLPYFLNELHTLLPL